MVHGLTLIGADEARRTSARMRRSAAERCHCIAPPAAACSPGDAARLRTCRAESAAASWTAAAAGGHRRAWLDPVTRDPQRLRGRRAHGRRVARRAGGRRGRRHVDGRWPCPGRQAPTKVSDGRARRPDARNSDPGGPSRSRTPSLPAQRPGPARRGSGWREIPSSCLRPAPVPGSRDLAALATFGLARLPERAARRGRAVDGQRAELEPATTPRPGIACARPTKQALGAPRSRSWMRGHLRRHRVRRRGLPPCAREGVLSGCTTRSSSRVARRSARRTSRPRRCS